MAVPTQTKLHRPILEFLSGVDEASRKETVDEIARRFSLSDTEIRERIASGGVTRLASNADFALSYLKGAGLVSQPARNKYKVTNTKLRLRAKNFSGNTRVIFRQGNYRR